MVKSSAGDATPTDGPLHAGTSLVMLLSSDEACGLNHNKDAIERFVEHVTDQCQSGPVIARGELAEPAVDGVDDHRSFANAGCHSFYGIGTNVADGEDPLNAACIEAGSHLSPRVVAGLDKLFPVECDAAVEPLRIRFGTNHEEQDGCRKRDFLSVLAPMHRFQIFLPGIGRSLPDRRCNVMLGEFSMRVIR